MAKLNYQLVEKVTWSDETLERWNAKRDDKLPKCSTFRKSYGTSERAIEEMNKKGLNDAVVARASKVIYKPTGEVLASRTW